MNNFVTTEETEALRSVHEMAELYGWRIPMIWTPALVKHMFQMHYGREMSDQEWDIFSSGQAWNSSVIMVGGDLENQVIIAAMIDAVEDAENAAAFEQMKEIYFLDEETNMQEAFDNFFEDMLGGE